MPQPLAPLSSLAANRHHPSHLLLLLLCPPQQLPRQLPLHLHLPFPQGPLATATKAGTPLQQLLHLLLLLALTHLARTTSVVLLLWTSLQATVQVQMALQLDPPTAPQDGVLHRATEMMSLARRLCLSETCHR